jgi:hypothetical protein
MSFIKINNGGPLNSIINRAIIFFTENKFSRINNTALKC